MALNTELAPVEAADRLSLREPFDAYAHCADRPRRRGAKGILHRRHPAHRLYGGRGQKADTRARATRSSHPGVRRSEPLRRGRPTGVWKRASHTDACDPAERPQPIIVVHSATKGW